MAGAKSQNCVSSRSPPGVFVTQGSSGHVGAVEHDRHVSSVVFEGSANALWRRLAARERVSTPATAATSAIKAGIMRPQYRWSRI